MPVSSSICPDKAQRVRVGAAPAEVKVGSVRTSACEAVSMKRFLAASSPVGPLSSLLSRRQFLADSGTGLGAIALTWLLHTDSQGAAAAASRPGPHFPPRAKKALHI